MAWYFLFFLVSGFCSILYELIWLRLAMAMALLLAVSVAAAPSTFVLASVMVNWLVAPL